MRAGVITFPGSNCDRDVAVALAACGARVERLWHGDGELPALDLIVLPGGFTYGDYLRCGAIAAHSPVMREVVRRAAAGVAVLGICNGFQILAEAGLLPGALISNAGLKFICRPRRPRGGDHRLRVHRRLRARPAIRCPSPTTTATTCARPRSSKRLEDEDRIAFRYLRQPERLDRRRSPACSAPGATCWASCRIPSAPPTRAPAAPMARPCFAA